MKSLSIAEYKEWLEWHCDKSNMYNWENEEFEVNGFIVSTASGYWQTIVVKTDKSAVVQSIKPNCSYSFSACNPERSDLDNLNNFQAGLFVVGLF